jgi:hypothetical protein
MTRGFSTHMHQVSLPFAATVLQFDRLGEKVSPPISCRCMAVDDGKFIKFQALRVSHKRLLG